MSGEPSGLGIGESGVALLEKRRVAMLLLLLVPGMAVEGDLVGGGTGEVGDFSAASASASSISITKYFGSPSNVAETESFLSL